MARIYPNWDTIQGLHQPPTAGELTMLKFLDDNLGDEYEVFFNAYLNGDRPDIVLMRKGGGILIIEVKDWNLDLYQVTEDKHWEVLTSEMNWQGVKSPFSQVFKYKHNLFDLHSKALLRARITNPKAYTIVQCAVFFSEATLAQYKDVVIRPFQGNAKYKDYLKFLSHFGVFTRDNLTTEHLKEYLHQTWISRRSRLFTDEHYESVKRYLDPPHHYAHEGKEIIYTKEQKTFLESVSGQRRKIKGVAGCGKTLVLAKRAVNAYLRTGKPILILTYNLSLVNYIRDRIADVKEDFPWSAFRIINYHQFFKAEANNWGLKINSLDEWNNPFFFEPVEDAIKPYEAVFIDEIQDYRTEWVELINRYYLDDASEFVVFGDEKQNIYDRPLDDEKQVVVRGVPGRWNRSLKTSYRFTENIAKLAARFQQKFLGRKYEIDDIAVIQQLEFGFESRIDYHKLRPNAPAEAYFEIIRDYVQEHRIHPSDVGILGATVDLIRKIDHLVRQEMREKTITTFEKEEYYQQQLAQCPHGIPDKGFSDDLEQKRRTKKLHFFMKTGTMKLSTIHSFKGWEIDTLFLIIDDLENSHDHGESFTSHELVYTAITRARRNLIVINAASQDYNDFFQQQSNSISAQPAMTAAEIQLAKALGLC